MKHKLSPHLSPDFTDIAIITDRAIHQVLLPQEHGDQIVNVPLNGATFSGKYVVKNLSFRQGSGL